MKNYYSVLGISPDATKDEIKRAYRRIALKTHPDKHGSSEEFREATEAYNYLKNKEPSPKQTPKRKSFATDIQIVLTVTIEEYAFGATKIFATSRKILCPVCEGTQSSLKKSVSCDKCSGRGIDPVSYIMKEDKPCDACEGSGLQPAPPLCTYCNGTGTIKKTIKKTINLYPLMSDTIRFKNEGNENYGKKTGDLIVLLQLKKHPLYTLQGLDLSGYIPISPAQAILGDNISLQVFDKTLEIKIPEGTSNGNKIKIEKGGITWGKKQGNFTAVLQIQLPKIVSSEEKILYQEILKLERIKR